MAKNLILFGAGASYGSDIRGTPPLANQLFDELVRFNPPGWGTLVNDYKSDFVNDFEQGILKVAKERPYELSILQRAMAAYFFHFKPLPTNLYYKLATILRSSPKDIALSTLNYERLLEISFTGAGHNLYVDLLNFDNGIELNFPHGCCHLFCEAATGNIIFEPFALQTNGQIKIISDSNEYNQRINNDDFPPAMSYFEPSKRTVSGYSFIMEQRERFSQLVLNAEIIIVIGIKIREHDIHIWETIKNSNARFIYCSGSAEKDVFDNWVLKYRPDKENIFVDGFWSDNFELIFNYLR